MNDLENRLLQDFFRPPQRRSNVLFTAVHPLLKGSSGLVFAAGSSDPIQVCEEAALGQRELSCFDFTSLKQKKVCRSGILQIGRLADCLVAFATIKNLGCRRSLFFALPQKPTLRR
jgi:hypothetical protein